jgi:hypothetical protein
MKRNLQLPDASTTKIALIVIAAYAIICTLTFVL